MIPERLASLAEFTSWGSIHGGVGRQVGAVNPFIGAYLVLTQGKVRWVGASIDVAARLDFYVDVRHSFRTPVVLGVVQDRLPLWGVDHDAADDRHLVTAKRVYRRSDKFPPPDRLVPWLDVETWLAEDTEVFVAHTEQPELLRQSLLVMAQNLRLPLWNREVFVTRRAGNQWVPVAPLSDYLDPTFGLRRAEPSDGGNVIHVDFGRRRA